MPRTLILFAHPALEKSRVHRRLVRNLSALAARTPGLTFRDLYEAYPDFDVDVAAEQALLAAHDLIVFQHPFYWYSTPALLKQWTDLVLEHGWAYGSQGHALDGKRWLTVLSLGGGAHAYQPGGYNRRTVRDFLAPQEQTARLCRMRFLPPYAVFGTHRMAEGDIEREGARYERLIAALAAGAVAWPPPADDPSDARVVTGDDADALLATAATGGAAGAAGVAA
jgi:glutathione-regulated potassium-efflux system ancillary protein KefG